MHLPPSAVPFLFRSGRHLLICSFAIYASARTCLWGADGDRASAAGAAGGDLRTGGCRGSAPAQGQMGYGSGRGSGGKNPAPPPTSPHGKHKHDLRWGSLRPLPTSSSMHLTGYFRNESLLGPLPSYERSGSISATGTQPVARGSGPAALSGRCSSAQRAALASPASGSSSTPAAHSDASMAPLPAVAADQLPLTAHSAGKASASTCGEISSRVDASRPQPYGFSGLIEDDA